VVLKGYWIPRFKEPCENRPVFLEKLIVIFMAPKLATGLYSEPDKFNPHTPSPSP
jgi:hypothetical protein